jgi:hypothetical protein
LAKTTRRVRAPVVALTVEREDAGICASTQVPQLANAVAALSLRLTQRTRLTLRVPQLRALAPLLHARHLTPATHAVAGVYNRCDVGVGIPDIFPDNFRVIAHLERFRSVDVGRSFAVGGCAARTPRAAIP